MTFEQFQASRRRETREIYAARIGVEPEFISAAHVLTYNSGSVYIEDNEGMGYFLLLGRDEFLLPDLGTLERLLYDWCDREGFFET